MTALSTNPTCYHWPPRPQDVILANVTLENGVHKGGWAAIHFASVEAASIAHERYGYGLLLRKDTTLSHQTPSLVFATAWYSRIWRVQHALIMLDASSFVSSSMIKCVHIKVDKGFSVWQEVQIVTSLKSRFWLTCTSCECTSL